MDRISDGKSIHQQQERSPYQAPEVEKSLFDGSAGALLGINLLTLLVTIVTLGIAYAWMVCWKKRYIYAHTVISGRRMRFEGKGLSLFGHLILWTFLTFITIGIFGFWLYVKFRKWETKSVVFEDGNNDSEFDGGMLGWLGTTLVVNFVSALTLMIAYPWMCCHFMRWDKSHMVISGNRLLFRGGGFSLLGHVLLWLLLTVVTLGIFAFWLEKKYLKWQIERTEIG